MLCRLVKHNVHLLEDFEDVCRLASFLDKETVSLLAEQNSRKVQSFAQVDNIACYLTPSALARVAFDNIEKVQSKKQISNICYHLDEKDREAFAKNAEKYAECFI